jgi:hypothetical protein
MVKNAHVFEARSRLLARIVRTLLASETFDSLADLTEALKARCARLGIPWTPDDISEAYRLIGSNVPLAGERRRLRERPTAAATPPQQLSRADAAAILERLGIIL